MTADLPALLNSLEATAAAATPGPWRTVQDWHIDAPSRGADSWVKPADAALIVAAVNALPTLIAELRRHQAAVQAVRELAAEWAKFSLLRGTADRIRAAVAALDPKEHQA